MSLFSFDPGEFKYLDKLQPRSRIEERVAVLRRLYDVDPALAADVISTVYPHSRKRPWLDAEVRQRLALPEIAKAAAQVLQTKKASEFFASAFPSLSAAVDAYDASRAQQAAMDAARRADMFPALTATQPSMYMAQQAMMGGGMPMATTPTHHHRRHRRHHT